MATLNGAYLIGTTLAPWQCFVLFLAIAEVGWISVPSVDAQRIPNFRIYPHAFEQVSMEEPKSVQLVDYRADGYGRFQWSAAYGSYHTATIRRGNFQLHAFCQSSSSAQTTVKHVKFFFTEFGKASAEEQVLVLESLSPTPARWPKFNRQKVSTNLEFTRKTGGYIILKFREHFDMSGRLRCELESDTGITLKSNVLDIFDVRQAVETMGSTSRISQNTQLYEKGVSIFDLGSGLDAPLARLVKYTKLDVTWSLGMEDSSFELTPIYKVLDTLFASIIAMQSSDVGKYFITRDGKLYLNMGSSLGVRVREYMEESGVPVNGRRGILIAGAASRSVGIKYFIKPDSPITSWPKLSPQTLPLRVEPRNDREAYYTYVGNLNDRISCGFLADHDPQGLSVVWFKDNSVLNENNMALFGVKYFKEGAGHTSLDLRTVKVEANGEWRCELQSGSGRVLSSGTYTMRVARFPGFGDYSDKLKQFIGKPPPLVFAVEGATIQVTCLATSYSADRTSAKPDILVDGVKLSRFCNPVEPITSPALCEIRSHLNHTLKPMWNTVLNQPYGYEATYILENAKYRSSSSNLKFGHVVTCSIEGIYDVSNSRTMLKTQAMTSVNTVPRAMRSAFNRIPLSCSQSGTACGAGESNSEFHCVLKESYLSMMKLEGVTVKKYWRVNEFSQDYIAGLEDSAPLKKYTEFSENQLTIKNVTSEKYLESLRSISFVRCVVELYYPSYVRRTDLGNLKVSGKGMVSPDAQPNSGRTRRAASSESSNVLFYSSELDSDADFLKASVFLQEPRRPPTASSAGGGIVAAVVLSILIILIIIVLVAYLMTRDRGETYVIDEKERAQGHNPEQELKDEQFKEYQRPEEGPIHGSRMSLASSIRVGSDDEGELDEYGDIDAGKFNEDGSFIGNYATDPRKKRLLPPMSGVV